MANFQDDDEQAVVLDAVNNPEHTRPDAEDVVIAPQPTTLAL
jgi:hypothetical protein